MTIEEQAELEQVKLKQKREAYYRSKRYTTEFFHRAFIAAIQGLSANPNAKIICSFDSEGYDEDKIATAARMIAASAEREYLECLDCIG